MARSDLLVSLLRAGWAGDKEQVKTTAEAIMADERAKKHFALAERLERAISAIPLTSSNITNASIAGNPITPGREAILEIQPRQRVEDLVLTLPAREGAKQLIEEHARADVLRAHGYEPRHRVLLSGPPGNGKTSFAEAIAEALALPLYLIRYDALIGSYLGETNTRLRRLFDYVRSQPSVVFFDEFDAIGKERGDLHETGEIKRVVSFLLMQLDQLPSYVITVAATNHAELLDRAVWRRFQMRLDFPAPDRKHIEHYIERVIMGWPNQPKVAPAKIASVLGMVSYAEALEFCQSVRRRQILGLGEVRIDDALNAELLLWAARVQPGASNGERSRETSSKTSNGKSRKKAKGSSQRRS